MSEKYNGIAGVRQAARDGKWLNPANLITALRVVLVLPIVILLLYSIDPPYNTIAGFIFILAALTDKADGYYARKNDAITRLGQFLDPLADKLLLIPVLVVLGYLNLIPWWAVAAVVAREVFVSVIRFISAKRRITFPATWSGKIKMFSQVLVVSVLIFFPGNAGDTWARILVYAMVAVTAYSGLVYVVRARREVFSAEPRADQPA